MTTKFLDINKDCSLKLDIQSNLNFNKTKMKQKVFRKFHATTGFVTDFNRN